MTRLLTGAVCCSPSGARACGGSESGSDQRVRQRNGKPVGEHHALDGVRRPASSTDQERGAPTSRPAPGTSTSRSSAGRTTTRSSRRSAAATRPTSRTRSRSDNTGAFCSGGAWVDLGLTCSRDGVSESIFPAAPQYYTEFEGNRCALPMLADTYGLYYNKKLLAKAGIKQPAEDDLRADRRREEADPAQPDGTLEGRRASTRSRASTRTRRPLGPSWGATWIDARANRALEATRGGRRCSSGRRAGRLVRLRQARQVQRRRRRRVLRAERVRAGKVAMNMDGEWRVAFIKSEHPELKYGDGAVPGRRRPARAYGAGYVTGSIIGIPKTSKHKDAGVDARQVPRHEPARAREALERDPERPDDERAR